MDLLKQDALPKPDALIEYPGGIIGAFMFHFTPAECSYQLYDQIARENDFEIAGAHMREDHPLRAEYEAGSGDVIRKWQPEPPPGWQFGGKHDTEDGPYAYFLRPAR